MTRPVIDGLLLAGTWLAWLLALTLLAGCSDSPTSSTRIVCTDQTTNSTQASACVEEN